MDLWTLAPSNSFVALAVATGKLRFPQPVVPLDWEQYGGAWGGLIKQDKLFFFANDERLHSFLGNALGTAAYTAPGAQRDHGDAGI